MYKTLVSADDLAAQLGKRRWVIMDCRFNLADPESGRRAYGESHIPGAQYAHLDADLSGPRSERTGRHPLPDRASLATRMGSWGIGADTQVVAYDEGGGAFAARLWWLLRWLGHGAVAVLDGGWKTWTQQCLPTSHDTPLIAPQQFNPGNPLSRPVDAAFVAHTLRCDQYRLVDVRAPARFAGHHEPIDKVAGHIPGAINIPFDHNLTEQGTFRSPEQLRALYLPHLAPTGPQDLLAMCGSGVTACHTLLALEHAGLSGARLYAGSWSDWITDPQRPVARSQPGT